MKNDNLIDEVCAQRFMYAFEETLQHAEAYRIADKNTESKLEEVLHLLQTAEQQAAVDELVAAHNACGVEYGKVAYRQGFEDGAKLLFEMYKLLLGNV
jgi:hypothetical protein